MDRYAAEANRLVTDEEEAREREDWEVAIAAGTCCTDPTPHEESGDGLDAGEALHYCEACGVTLEDDMYAALVADLPAARARVARIRTERRGFHEA